MFFRFPAARAARRRCTMSRARARAASRHATRSTEHTLTRHTHDRVPSSHLSRAEASPRGSGARLTLVRSHAQRPSPSHRAAAPRPRQRAVGATAARHGRAASLVAAALDRALPAAPRRSILLPPLGAPLLPALLLLALLFQDGRSFVDKVHIDRRKIINRAAALRRFD